MKDIHAGRFTDGRLNLRRFHQARWDEPVIMELSQPGQRGILLPEVEPEIQSEVGDVLATIPEGMRRQSPPALPELSQAQVLRHYDRISQETLGADLNVDIGQGTCTMKYNPKINDQVAHLPNMSELHPLQDEDTVQGILEILYRFEQILKEIAGLDRFTFQPGAGSQAIWVNASIIRAYHAARGQADQRDEIITTIFSHPSDAACPKTAGFKVITLYPGEDGYPTVDSLKAALSERTAGIMMTNPEDTGIFNPKVAEFTRLVHEAGGLCSYDQANANGIVGITRAGDAGFDLCHFNLHKTFSTPHGCGGPAAGATGVTRELAKFLPAPLVEYDGEKYFLNDDLPDSIGKVHQFLGCPQVVLRAYTWVMNLGADGLREVAEIAVLNNNYLLSKMQQIRGVSAPYAPGQRRIEQVRYSWEQLHQDTGLTTDDVGARVTDFGTHYWTSHHPFVVPEPATLEPTEAYSKIEIDEYAQIMQQVSDEAYANPDFVKNAPYNTAGHRTDQGPLNDPAEWATTWRAYKRKLAAKKGSR